MQISKHKNLITIAFGLLAISGAIYMELLKNSLDLLSSYGIAQEYQYFLLILPFISLFMAVSRIIIGINLTNTLIPSFMVISSFILGFFLTMEIIVLSYIFGFILKRIIGDWRFHYAVKSSIIVTMITVFLIVIIPFLNIPKSLFANGGPLLIIMSAFLIYLINEKFLSYKVTGTNTKITTRLLLNSLLFTLITFFILGGEIVLGSYTIHFYYLQNLILKIPDIIFVALFLTILIGKYTGLRLTEIYRFRHLLFKNN